MAGWFEHDDEHSVSIIYGNILTLQRTSHCAYELKNKLLDFRQNNVILLKKMATCFDLRDHHQAIKTKILKIRSSAVQIKLVIFVLH